MGKHSAPETAQDASAQPTLLPNVPAILAVGTAVTLFFAPFWF